MQRAHARSSLPTKQPNQSYSFFTHTQSIVANNGVFRSGEGFLQWKMMAESMLNERTLLILTLYIIKTLDVDRTWNDKIQSSRKSFNIIYVIAFTDERRVAEQL